MNAKQLKRLRLVQSQWQRMADLPGVRQTAKLNAQLQADRIERIIENAFGRESDPASMCGASDTAHLYQVGTNQ